MGIVLSVNGLNKDDIVVLYDLLVRFENDFQTLKSKEFNKIYPYYKGLEELLIFEKKTYAELAQLVNSAQLNHVYMTGGKNPLEFIKHLRNAFAHSQLVKNKDIEIKDYRNRKNQGKTIKSFSAYGVITPEVFEKIIKFLSNQIK